MIGPTFELFSKDVAMADITNGFDAFTERHALTEFRLPEHQFRVVSYNLLADFYADSDYSRNELFPYCPPYALAIDYRKRLMLRELRGYNGDVICLQELDKNTYEGDLKGVLHNDSFDSIYTRKGVLPEGLATFYNIEKFRCLSIQFFFLHTLTNTHAHCNSPFSLIKTYELSLGQGILLEPSLASLYNQIKDNTALCERMLALPSVLQVS